ncbi:MAG: decaprenyl-phosphate phosphoribosyltransferase [Candidatus Nanopelagicales bacterium]
MRRQPRSGSVRVTNLIALARPKQWIKNVLVFAAPLAAGVLLEPRVLLGVVATFVSFCFAASAVYMINDVLDAEHDQNHPHKKYRPVAAGSVAPRTAVLAAVFCAVASLVIPASLARIEVAGVVLAYLLLQAAYVWKLKQEAVIDIAVIAGGFLLRAVAGGVAANVEISNAFFVVVGFGTFFMATGKRFSEIMAVPQNGAQTRAALHNYTPGYLRILLAVSVTVSLVGYILWAFEIQAITDTYVPFAVLSIIPVTLALMRYAQNIESAYTEDPENAIFADRWLVGLGLIWFALFAAQVFQR